MMANVLAWCSSCLIRDTRSVKFPRKHIHTALHHSLFPAPKLSEINAVAHPEESSLILHIFMIDIGDKNDKLIADAVFGGESHRSRHREPHRPCQKEIKESVSDSDACFGNDAKHMCISDCMYLVSNLSLRVIKSERRYPNAIHCQVHGTHRQVRGTLLLRRSQSEGKKQLEISPDNVITAMKRCDNLFFTSTYPVWKEESPSPPDSRS